MKSSPSVAEYPSCSYNTILACPSVAPARTAQLQQLQAQAHKPAMHMPQCRPKPLHSCSKAGTAAPLSDHPAGAAPRVLHGLAAHAPAPWPVPTQPLRPKKMLEKPESHIPELAGAVLPEAAALALGLPLAAASPPKPAACHTTHISHAVLPAVTAHPADPAAFAASAELLHSVPDQCCAAANGRTPAWGAPACSGAACPAAVQPVRSWQLSGGQGQGASDGPAGLPRSCPAFQSSKLLVPRCRGPGVLECHRTRLPRSCLDLLTTCYGLGCGLLSRRGSGMLDPRALGSRVPELYWSRLSRPAWHLALLGFRIFGSLKQGLQLVEFPSCIGHAFSALCEVWPERCCDWGIQLGGGRLAYGACAAELG